MIKLKIYWHDLTSVSIKTFLPDDITFSWIE